MTWRPGCRRLFASPQHKANSVVTGTDLCCAQACLPVQQLVEASQGVAAEPDVADQAVLFKLLQHWEGLLDDLWSLQVRPGHSGWVYGVFYQVDGSTLAALRHEPDNCVKLLH